MGIVDEDIAKVREATDAIAVIGEHVALKRVGTRLQGLCPFHSERSPSFSVNPAEGLYYCFGCQARGDVITFVRQVHHLDFVGAIEWLAARAGIELRYDSPAATRDHHRRAQLTDAMAKAVEWYHSRLLDAPDAGPARRYLRHE
ncbi:MAG TPA: CHC2 zinc finger domain-containing protein, partial [Acidimicrobiales bacterium]|nr:CHC2 zinc finger domain-containing protein [Acidimicrobiales bacterium]